MLSGEDALERKIANDILKWLKQHVTVLAQVNTDLNEIVTLTGRPIGLRDIQKFPYLYVSIMDLMGPSMHVLWGSTQSINRFFKPLSEEDDPDLVNKIARNKAIMFGEDLVEDFEYFKLDFTEQPEKMLDQVSDLVKDVDSTMRHNLKDLRLSDEVIAFVKAFPDLPTAEDIRELCQLAVISNDPDMMAFYKWVTYHRKGPWLDWLG